MSAKVNSFIYPYTEQVRNLPVFLTGIGGTEYQEHIKRAGENSCWDQILYCIKGKGCLKYGKETIDLIPGDVFLMPRYTGHEYFPYQKKWEVRWIVFDGSNIVNLMKELGLDEPTVVHADDLSALQKLFNKIFITLKADKIYGNYLCSGLTYQFIMEFHRLFLNGSASDGNIRNEIVMSALNYIEDNFKNDFSVKELAAVSSVSQQYLGRIFRQIMNTSPIEYVINRRVREAKTLLIETDKSIAEISQLCGFSNPGYFCTVFKKTENTTPIAYRKNNR